MDKSFSLKLEVRELINEINGKYQTNVIDKLEAGLSTHINELAECNDFFDLPLKNIFSIISKVDFSLFGGDNDVFKLINDIIKNTIRAHPQEEELLLIMKYININSISLNEEQYVSILDQFNDCQFLHKYCSLCNERLKMPIEDIRYEVREKEKEIEYLKQKIKELDPNQQCIEMTEFPDMTEEPSDLELDIIKACEKGKLSSIRWLIEKECIDPNITNNEKENLIFIAAKTGNLPIVQYFIEKQIFDIDVKGDRDLTPLYCALENGHQHVAQYLIFERGRYLCRK